MGVSHLSHYVQWASPSPCLLVSFDTSIILPADLQPLPLLVSHLPCSLLRAASGREVEVVEKKANSRGTGETY